MPEFQRRRSGDDVVVVRRKIRPKPVQAGKPKSKKILPKKELSFKPAQDVKVATKTSKTPQQEKPDKQSRSAPVKKKKYPPIDPEIYFAIVPKINALLPEAPFKLGTSNEIFGKFVDSCGVSNKLLRRVINRRLGYITNGKNYLKILAKASHRYGLDGSKTEISEEHRESAIARVEYIRARQKRSLSKFGKSNLRK
jgi:hypothetical protein